MKKYDNNAKCKKCGHGGIDDEHIRYSPARLAWADYPTKEKVKFTEIHEHILRTCRNCGYSWRESPVDKPIKIMECEHAKSCDTCRPLNTATKYHGMKPCEAEHQKYVDDFIRRNTVVTPIKVNIVRDKTLDDMHGDKTIREHLKSLDTPVIEVGDVVVMDEEVIDDKGEHGLVVAIDNTTAGKAFKPIIIQWNDNSVGRWRPQDLTLVRKGPKVHVFEGVEWYMAASGLITPSLRENKRLRELAENGKTYTLTLIKEDTK